MGRIWLDWVGLGWIWLDCVRLGQIGLDWVGLGPIGPDWVGLGWIGSDLVGFGWGSFWEGTFLSCSGYDDEIFLYSSEPPRSELPAAVQQEYYTLEQEFKEGDITEKGFKKKKLKLLTPYLVASKLLLLDPLIFCYKTLLGPTDMEGGSFRLNHFSLLHNWNMPRRHVL